MKRSAVIITLFFLLLSAVSAYSGSPAAFTEERATITKNGVDTSGRVFVQADNPATLLVSEGDSAFLVNRSTKAVHSVAINGISEASGGVMIDFGTLSQVEGAGLIVGADGSVAFLAAGDRYVVTPQGRMVLDPL